MLETGSAAVGPTSATAFINPAEEASLHFLSQGGILSSMTKMVMDSIGADGLCVAYAEQGKVVCRASCGNIAPAVGTPLNVNSGIGAQCLREGKTTICGDTETDPRVNREVCRRIGVRSILAVPLRLNSAVIGIAQAFYAKPSGFSEANILELEQSARLFVGVLPVDADGKDSGQLSQRTTEPVVEEPTTSLRETTEPAPSVGEEIAPEEAITDSAQEAPPEVPESVSEKLAAEPSFASFPQIEAPAWWKRPTLPAVALSAVLGLVWAATHSSSHPLVPFKPANPASTMEKSDLDLSSLPFAQLQSKARAGDSTAQLALAKRYETGNGGGRSLTKAYSWYIVASEAGNDAARQAIRPLTSKLTAAQIAAVRFEVARMYANGIGVRTRDPVAAYAWMMLADAAGDRRAKAEQNVLAASMRPQEIAEAQTRASYWLKSRGYSTR